MSDSTRLKLLYQVIEIANSSIDLRERQEQILDATVRALGIKEAVLFLQNQENKAFVPSFSFPRDLQSKLPLMWHPGKELMNSILLHHQPILLNQVAYDDRVLKLLTQRGIVLLLPVFDDSNFYGLLLLVGYAPPEVGDGILLKSVTRTIAGMVRNFANYRESRKRITELSLLADIGKVGTSSIQIERLLQTTIDLVCRFLGAGFGVIALQGQGEKFLAHYGSPPPHYKGPEDCWRHACAKKPVNHIHQHLSFQGDYRGMICLFDKYPGEERHSSFNADEQRLLSIMGNMLAPAMENALGFRHVKLLADSNAEMVRALAILYEIGNHLLISASSRRRIMLTLGALAHPKSFNFARAIFFSADHHSGKLEARAFLDSDALQGSLAASLLHLSRQAPEKLMEIYGVNPSFSYRLDNSGHFLVNALRRNRLRFIDKRPARLNKALTGLMGGDGPWLVLPLASRGQGVGVVLLVCRPGTPPLSPEQQNLLKMLSYQAEMAIEGSLTLQNLQNTLQELADMQTRLQEADRLAGLGEIVSGMAHEIRNPLMSIGGFVRRIRGKTPDSDENARYMDMVLEQVVRVERLLNEMFAIPYDTRENYQLISMEKVLDKSLALFGEKIDSVEVVREYQKGLPLVYGDEKLLQKSFFNIILNALQAMGYEGRLVLRTRMQLIDNLSMVGGEVEDSGGGIPLEIMHNVFNPFFTTKSRGSGLGLSHAHKIVSGMEGIMEVHNQGKGAAFVVYLPARPSARGTHKAKISA